MRRPLSVLPVALTLAALIVAGAVLEGALTTGPRAPLALSSGLLGIGFAGAVSRLRRATDRSADTAEPIPDDEPAPVGADAAAAEPPAEPPVAQQPPNAPAPRPSETEPVDVQAALLVRVAARQLPVIERLLAVLEELEESERDAAHLAELFVLDQLATRLRRHTEVLLALGQGVPQAGSHPVPVLGMLRAAVAEVTGFDTVTLDRCPAVAIRAELAAPFSHLVAEVIDTADHTGRPGVHVAAALDGERLVVTVHDLGKGGDLTVAQALAARLDVELETRPTGQMLLRLPAAALATPAPTSSEPTAHVLDTVPRQEAGGPQAAERPLARVSGGGQRLVARPARRLGQGGRR